MIAKRVPTSLLDSHIQVIDHDCGDVPAILFFPLYFPLTLRMRSESKLGLSHFLDLAVDGRLYSICFTGVEVHGKFGHSFWRIFLYPYENHFPSPLP